MAEPQGKPEIMAAVMKGAIAEAVLLAVGAAIYWGTGEIAWIIGGAIAGSTIMLLLLAQAGAFTRP
jgi:hypothetical protein